MAEIPGASARGFARAGVYEITWREYGEAVRRGGCRTPIGVQVQSNPYNARWLDERAPPDDKRFSSTLPVTGVNSADIECYLRWLNGATVRNFRLPSPDQWRWLAYGESRSRFPWGEEAEFGRANVGVGGRFHFDVATLGRPNTYDTVLPVGRFAPNAFGLYDVIGNAKEYIGQCEPRTLGVSQSTRPTCVAMGGYAPPVIEDPREPERFFMLNDGSVSSIGFRIIE
ncbi:MAG TPA: SUMF1/EgtB/PvdO family nonheme iron enzyme [Croceibacterium sp.]